MTWQAPIRSCAYPSPSRTGHGGRVDNAADRDYDYTAFGERWTDGTSEEVSQRYTYTGREKHDRTHLMYYRYRMYEPRVGRFTARDPNGYFRDGEHEMPGVYGGITLMIEMVEGSQRLTPIGFVRIPPEIESASLYAYVSGMPHMLVDPKGLTGTCKFRCTQLGPTYSGAVLHIVNIQHFVCVVELDQCDPGYICPPPFSKSTTTWLGTRPAVHPDNKKCICPPPGAK